MSLRDASRAKSPREAFVRLVPNRREKFLFVSCQIAGRDELIFRIAASDSVDEA